MIASEAEARLMEMTVTSQTYHLHDLRVRLLDRIMDSLNSLRSTAGQTPVQWDRTTFILLLQAMHGTGLARSYTGYLNDASRTFESAEANVNSTKIHAPNAAARRLVTSEGGFLGAHFDYIAKTVKLTEKTRS